MSDFQANISSAVQDFVTRIAELARQAAINTVSGIDFASEGAPVKNGSSRGNKRTAEDLEKLSGSFASFVRDNPGLRIEQINKELGTTTKDLALPIRKLIAEGVIKVKGQKRSTTYFPGKKA